MPVPSDIRDAVRKDLETRALQLDSRAVFDHRTNMMRAKIAMMLQHNDKQQLGEKEKQRKRIHQQKLMIQQQQQQQNSNNKNHHNNKRVLPLGASSRITTPSPAFKTTSFSAGGGTATTTITSDDKNTSNNNATGATTSTATANQIDEAHQQALAQNLLDDSKNANTTLLSTVSDNINNSTTTATNINHRFSSNMANARLTPKQAKEFLTKTKFGHELSHRLERVNSSLVVNHPHDSDHDNNNNISTKRAIKPLSSPILEEQTGNNNNNNNNNNNTGGESYLNSFVARNAKDAAIASDARVEKRLQQMMMASSSLPPGDTSNNNNTNIPASPSTTSSKPKPPPSNNFITSPSSTTTTTTTTTKKPKLPSSSTEEKKKSSNSTITSPTLATETANNDQQQQQQETETEEEKNMTDEEKQARRQFLSAIERRQRIMTDHPPAEDELQLQSTSGWVQRAMERKNLEDDDDLFQYRMKLKEKDDKKRAASPVERYQRGFSNTNNAGHHQSPAEGSSSSNNNNKGARDKIPGSDTALQLGVGSLFKPASLIPEMYADEITTTATKGGKKNYKQDGNNNENKKNVSGGNGDLSAVDDTRHRQQLVRFNTILPEREKLATKAGVELYESAPRLMSQDFDFMGDAKAMNHQENHQQEDSSRRTNNNNNNKNYEAESSDSDTSSEDDDDYDDDDFAGGENESNNNNNNQIGRSRRKSSFHSGGGSMNHQKLKDIVDLLESSTVSACELIMSNNASIGALNSPTARSSSATQYRPTDATVIKNILKRSLVILAPTVRKAIRKAKRSNANNTVSKISDDYKDIQRQQSELKKQQQQLSLLRSWLKGCEIWIASELGLDSHAGFFSVSDKTHLREFCSLYARMKQVSERNAEALMRRWQRDRDIMTADPTSLVSVEFYGKPGNNNDDNDNNMFNDDEHNNDEGNNSNNEHHHHQGNSSSSSDNIVTLPAELSNFFNVIKIGSGNTTMMRSLFGNNNNNNNNQQNNNSSSNKNQHVAARMTSDKAAVIGREAKEATSKYFETLEKFGVITASSSSSDQHQQHSSSSDSNNTKAVATSGSALRLKNMLRKFAGIEEEDVIKYQQKEEQRLRESECRASESRRGSTASALGGGVGNTSARRKSSVTSTTTSVGNGRRPSSAAMLLEQAKHRAEKMARSNSRQRNSPPGSASSRRQSRVSSSASQLSNNNNNNNNQHDQDFEMIGTTSTTVANLFQCSLMRSVMINNNNNQNDGSNNSKIITPSSEVASRVIATEAHDTVSVLELFITLLGEPTRIYIREEIEQMMRYFHDTAPDRSGEVQSIDSSRDGERFFGFDPEEKRREKHALQSVHAQLLHLSADDTKVDHDRIAQLRRAIDKTDAWVHISEDNTGVTAKHLALVSGESTKHHQQQSNTINNEPGASLVSEQSIGGGTTSATSRWHSAEDTNVEMRSATEERQRAQALQKLAAVWKQLYVPFQYRMELLEKYRNAPTVKVLAAEQRYSECVSVVTKRESIINGILEWANKMAAEEASNNIAQRQQQQQAHQQIMAGGGGGRRSDSRQTTVSSSSGSAANNNNNNNIGRRSASPSSLSGGGDSSGNSREANYAMDAEVRRQRQQKKQQMLADFSSATAACDAAIEKLSSIGEHLYYHQVLYATKMKDDFANVSKVLRGGKDASKD